ncbi:MAG: hypothetical protein WC093_01515 [Methanoculleus sp.]
MNVRGLARILAVLVLAGWICSTAAAQEMTIDEVESIAAGETVTIGGTTNLAPGNRLLVEVTPVAFGPGNASVQGGTSGTAVVEAGNETANTWSFAMDTTGFEPGEYTVTVDWVEGDATASTTFTVVEAGTVAPTATVTVQITPPATEAPEPSPTPTAAGSALPVTAAIAAAAAGVLVRRR